MWTLTTSLRTPNRSTQGLKQLIIVSAYPFELRSAISEKFDYGEHKKTGRKYGQNVQAERTRAKRQKKNKERRNISQYVSIASKRIYYRKKKTIFIQNSTDIG